jgi:hypothetical protein
MAAPCRRHCQCCGLDAVQQLIDGVLHIVKDLGAIIGSLLRLDLPRLINAVLHLLLDVGILILDAPNLRIYAQTASEVRDRIQFATKHCNGMGIRPTWNHFITVLQRTPLVTHSITLESEFNLICLRDFLDTDGNVAVEIDDLGQFLNDTGLKDLTEDETNITSITQFHVLAQVFVADDNLVSSDDFFGDTAGRDIEEGDPAEGCQTANRTAQCCILVKLADEQRQQLGSGVGMRNVYPGFFSKMVMAQEMGHYFGLCHINHNGVQNIMFSNAGGNRLGGLGAVRLLLECRTHLHAERQEECVALHRRPAAQRTLARGRAGM